MESSTSEYSSMHFGGEGPSLFGELMKNDSDVFAPRAESIVSNTTAFYFKILVYIFLSGSVSIIGIVANIVNIIVFTRQGIFTDGGSPSLLGLAVSDLCCVISMLWLSISFLVVLADPPVKSWDPWAIQYITGAWPHLMFAQITRMVTAYVAFERCICVVFPFKVKSIFTPRRSITIIAGIFVCCGLSYSPVFITEQLKFRLDPYTNITRLVLISAPNWRLIVDIMCYINSISFNIASVAIVFICTMITVSRVKLSKAWRQSLATGSSSKPEKTRSQNTTTLEPASTDHGSAAPKPDGNIQSGQMTKSKMQKEKKLVVMIILISVTFLICYSPDLTFLIMNSVNSEIRILGRYENLAMVMYSFTFLMETINSSTNIIIYYTMSSKYKQEFKLIFGPK